MSLEDDDSRDLLYNCHSPLDESSTDKKKPGFHIFCIKCGKGFRYKWQLNLHSRIHENKVYFRCPHCPSTFICISHLNKHLVSHAKERPFKCSYCDKCFKSKNTKKSHEDTHNHNKYNCRYCELTFSRYQQKNRHERDHRLDQLKTLKGENDDALYKCAYCIAVFSSEKFLEKHKKLRHYSLQKVIFVKGEDGEISYKCKFCEDIFADKEILREHVYLVHKINTDSTKMSESRDNMFKCSICSERFNRSKELRAHAKSKHPNEWKKIFFKMCSFCNKYITRNYYSSHLLLHKGLRPFQCGQCDSKFPCSGDLRTHIKFSHNKSRVFQCYWCKDIVKSKQEIETHKLLHLGRKTHKCGECDSAFHTSLLLNNHKERMHIRKMRTCNICQKEIKRLDWKRHMKVNHTNNKKLCDHCGKTFLNEYKLISHFKVLERLGKVTNLHYKSVGKCKTKAPKKIYSKKKNISHGECSACGFTSHSRLQLELHMQHENFVLELKRISYSSEKFTKHESETLNKTVISKKYSQTLNKTEIFNIYSQTLNKTEISNKYSQTLNEAKIYKKYSRTARDPIIIDRPNGGIIYIMPLTDNTFIPSVKHSNITNTETCNGYKNFNTSIDSLIDSNFQPVINERFSAKIEAIRNGCPVSTNQSNPKLISKSVNLILESNSKPSHSELKNISAFSITFGCRKCLNSNTAVPQSSAWKGEKAYTLKCLHCGTSNKYIINSVKLPIWPTSRNDTPINSNIEIDKKNYMNPDGKMTNITVPLPGTFKPFSVPLNILNQHSPRMHHISNDSLSTVINPVVKKKPIHLENMRNNKHWQANSLKLSDTCSSSVSDISCQNFSKYVSQEGFSNPVIKKELESLPKQHSPALSLTELDELRGCDVDTLLSFLQKNKR